MLKEQLRQIVAANPDYAAVTPVIEKEILHHDIMDVMIRQGAMQTLTFIGGTSLRMCYNSARLSEDLDFNGGHDFKPAHFDGLELEIRNTSRTSMKPRYGSTNRPRVNRGIHYPGKSVLSKRPAGPIYLVKKCTSMSVPCHRLMFKKERC